MGDWVRNCKRVAAMDSSSSTSSVSKKVKLDFGLVDELEEAKLASLNFELQSDCLVKVIPEKRSVSLALSSSSGALPAGDLSSGDSSFSRCSSNESSEVVKNSFRFVDLEAKNSETESSTCINNNVSKSRETTPSSECCGDTDEMDSKMPAKRACREKPSTTAKMPSQVEIDEFFAVAEQEERKRFAEKYNYDIAKDAPLQGRYEWVRLQP